MKVILLDNVKGLGRSGDIKEVADGYAHNFLLPNKLADLATSDNIKKIEQVKSSQAKKAEQDLLATEKLANKLGGAVVEISGKTNDAGKLYAAISQSAIAKKLKEQGLDISKSQIKLAQPIKEVGEYQVVVALDHGLEVEITVVASD